MDYFLKSADEAELLDLLSAAGVVLIGSDAPVLVPGFALDLIGRISKPTGEKIMVDGIEVDAVAPIPGYHANLRGELAPEQKAILRAVLLSTVPSSPVRVWL